MSNAPPNACFSAFAFLGVVTTSLPLYWHVKARNVGTCLFMGWTLVPCFVYFVNSIIWNHSAVVQIPVWCDISARIIIATNVGIPCASLCIKRQLYKLAAMTPINKRRDLVIDLSIGLGVPTLQMILAYVVQGHRADIFEDVGCWPSTVNTALSFVLSACWPLIIGIISGVYGTVTIYRVVSRKRSLNNMLAATSGPPRGWYLRLLALSSLDAVLVLPVAALDIYLDRKAGPIVAWMSWDDTHVDFNRFDSYPAVLWKANPMLVLSLESTRWNAVLCAFVFFAFFGLAEEARVHYKLAYGFARRWATRGARSVAGSTFTIRQQGKTRTIAPLASGRPLTYPTMSATKEEKWRLSLDFSRSTLSIGDHSIPAGIVDGSSKNPHFSNPSTTLRPQIQNTGSQDLNPRFRLSWFPATRRIYTQQHRNPIYCPMDC